jgi:uncharacterized membrane protein YcjF (UPF0283 family)
MENAFARAEELAAAVKEYADTRIKELKLNAAEKASGIIANLVAGMAVVLLLLLCIVFASIALALLLGLWLQHTWAGFLMVAGLYLVFGIVIWFMRTKWIRLPFMNAMIGQFFKMDENEEN